MHFVALRNSSPGRVAAEGFRVLAVGVHAGATTLDSLISVSGVLVFCLVGGDDDDECGRTDFPECVNVDA